MGKDRDHQHPPSDMTLRVKALETALTDSGYIDPASLDAIVDLYENQVGPRNGAKVVAKAWVDPDFKSRLLKEGAKTISDFGFPALEGENLVVVENTPAVHNMIVCTLCSCYPWPVLGLPPTWYKSAAYRSRAVSEPRAVLQEFGVSIDAQKEVRVWDSTAEIRYLVLPERPSGTEELSEDQLAELVTRDSMIGTGIVQPPSKQASK